MEIFSDVPVPTERGQIEKKLTEKATPTADQSDSFSSPTNQQPRRICVTFFFPALWSPFKKRRQIVGTRTNTKKTIERRVLNLLSFRLPRRPF